MLIIVPLYRGAELIPELVASLKNVAGELVDLSAEVLFINDSPDDADLREALQEHLLSEQTAVPFEVVVNERNEGFIRSCNKGLERCLEEGRDAILLNSDALVTPGALREIVAAGATDPMIGFVSPRSNNATICNAPVQDKYNHAPLDAAIAAHRQLANFLPRITYVPTAVGFCLYIKHMMLAEFGLLNEIYGKGYNEENDFILRCNRRGFRAALANHAFVYHFGGASFSLTGTPTTKREKANSLILAKRYPEFYDAIRRYFDGSYYEAEGVLSGFVTPEGERPKILFECSNLGDFYNGTFELTVKGLRAFAEAYSDRYEIHTCCNLEAYTFHALGELSGVRYVGEHRHAVKHAPYRHVVRLSQPFSTDELRRFSRLAPVVTVMILDTIGYDCLYLDQQGVGDVWRQLPDMVDAIGYISQYSEDQYLRRFASRAHMTNFVALLSTDVEEYEVKTARPGQIGFRSGYVLIVGNHYFHKNVAATVSMIRASHPDLELVVLGGTANMSEEEEEEEEKEKEDSKVHFLASGSLSADMLKELYAECAVLVFPSFYEGFGFPIVNGLSHGKPVIARDIPVAREIKAKSPGGENIHLFPTTREIANAVGQNFRWMDPDPALRPQRWSDFATALERGLQTAESRFEFPRLVNRLELASWHGRGAPYSRHPAAIIGRLAGAGIEAVLRAAARNRYIRAVAEPIWKRRRSFRRLLRSS
jgi:glycosyltransferase involved in cell wall biosynthesis